MMRSSSRRPDPPTTTTASTTTMTNPTPKTKPRNKRDKLLDGLRQVELAVRRAKEHAMTLTKERPAKNEENGSETAKENVNCEKINSKNQEKLTDEKGEDNSRRTVPMGDDDEEGEEGQELSDYEDDGSADDYEEETEIPDELNRRAMEILTLLQKKEEDPEQKDESMVVRLQELEEQRVKILQEDYPYSFTQWVEKKWETPPPQEKEKRRRREELWKKNLEKEERRKKAKAFRKQRKFLEEECTRAKESMRRGGNKGDKDVTGEEGEGRGAIKEKKESKGGNRKQLEEGEKRRSKRKEKHYRGVEEVKVTVKKEERVTRGMDQERKTQEVKNQSTVERGRLQKAVEEEAKSEEREEKKINILKLEIRQKKKKDMTKLDAEEGREPPLMKEKGKETKVERRREKDGVLREATQKRTPEGASRTQQGAGGGRRRGGDGRRRHHERPPRQASCHQKQTTSRDHTKKDSRPSGYATSGNRTTAGREYRYRHSSAAKSSGQKLLVGDVPLDSAPDHRRVNPRQFGGVADRDLRRRGKYPGVDYWETDRRGAAQQAGTVSLPGGAVPGRFYGRLEDRRTRNRDLHLDLQRPVLHDVASKGRVTTSRGRSRRVWSPVLPPGRC